MEDKDGNQVSDKKKDAVRAMARAFYEGLLKNNTAPTAWGNATVSIRHQFINLLETEFFFLRLCDGHWKANQVATNGYSQWYTGAVGRKAALEAKRASKGRAEQIIDVELTDSESDGKSDERASDQSRGEGDNAPVPPKQPRVEDSRPTSISRPRPNRISPRGKNVRKSVSLD